MNSRENCVFLMPWWCVRFENCHEYMQSKNFSLEDLFVQIQGYLRSILDSVLYSVGCSVVRYKLEFQERLILLLLGSLFFLFLLIGFAYAFSSWLNWPIYAGFFCVSGLILLAMLLFILLTRMRRVRMRDRSATKVLQQVEELRSMYYSSDAAKEEGNK